jgi:hypothetical protein
MALQKITKTLLLNTEMIVSVEALHDTVIILVSSGEQWWEYKVKPTDLHIGFKNNYGI